MKPKATFRGVVLGREQAKRAAATAPVPTGPAKVRVGRETSGRGGKGVTVITGLPLSGDDLADLAARLKRSCGAGGAARGNRIEIQGEHRDRLVAALKALGYDARRAGG